MEAVSMEVQDARRVQPVEKGSKIESRRAAHKSIRYNSYEHSNNILTFYIYFFIST